MNENTKKNILTSVFASKEDADKLSAAVIKKRKSGVNGQQENEEEMQQKNILTSAFANKEAADQLTDEVIKRRQLEDIKPIIYERQENDAVYTYNVIYDKEKLEEILEKLKKYKYITVGKGQMSGEVTKWPATKKTIEKRVVDLFYLSPNSLNDTLHPETIVHHTENGNDFVTYEYSFEELPDLYHYIDIIVNNKSVIDYTGLFGYETGTLNIFYAMDHQDQLVVEKILNYIDSPQLVNHDTDTIIKVTDLDYDYKGLNELYKEALECFKFKLIAVKKYIDNQETISGLVLQKKR